MKRSLTTVAAAAAIVLLLTAACGTSETPSAGGKPTLSVGFNVHSSGVSGQFGITVQRAAELAKLEIATAGGADLQLHFEDNQLNPQLALTEFQKLVDIYKTPVVISGGTAPVMAMAGAAADRKVLVINVAAVSPVLHSAAPWVINLVPTADKEGAVLAEYLNSLGVKKIAAVNVNNDFGNKSMEAFVDSFSKLGGTLLRQEKSDSGSTDFRPQLLRIKAVNPDAIVIMANQGENGLIVNQAVQLGFRSDQLFGTTYMLTPDNFKTGGAAMNGVRGVAFRFDKTKNDMAKAFASSFKAKWGDEADIQGATVTTAVRLIDEAVRQGAKTGEELRAKIVGVKDYPSVFGPLNFDDTGTVQLEIERWSIANDAVSYQGS